MASFGEKRKRMRPRVVDMADERLVLDDQLGLGTRRRLGAQRQDQFEDGEVLDAVGGRRQPIEAAYGRRHART